MERQTQDVRCETEALLTSHLLPHSTGLRERGSRAPFDWQERRHLAIYRHALSRGVLLRPLGSVVYFMPPYVITPGQIDRIVEVAQEGIDLAVRGAA